MKGVCIDRGQEGAGVGQPLLAPERMGRRRRWDRNWMGPRRDLRGFVGAGSSDAVLQGGIEPTLACPCRQIFSMTYFPLFTKLSLWSVCSCIRRSARHCGVHPIRPPRNGGECGRDVG